MNKNFTKNIPRILLLIFTALSSGCAQTSINKFPTPINTLSLQTSTSVPVISPTVTVTSLPCISINQTPKTEIEQIAEKWFLSDIPQISQRSQYRLSDMKEGINVCGVYQYYLMNNKEVYSPMDISLHIITQSPVGGNYFSIDNLVVVAKNSKDLLSSIDYAIPPAGSRDVVIIVVAHSYLNVHFETRTDYIFENDIWKIRWSGSRWKCININNPIWKTDRIDCP